MKEQFSLGHTTVRSHGHETGMPVVTLNYVNGDYRMPLPYPDGDWYLRQTAVPALRPGEAVICHTLIPGLLGYYRQVGLLHEGADVLEVESGEDYGFPSTDPLALLDGVGLVDHGSPLSLVSTFSNDHVDEQARRLGLETLTRPDSAYMNDKAVLRRKAEGYGIRMLPGACVTSWEELDMVSAAAQSPEHGVWVKAPTGSGGDLVYHVTNMAQDGLREAVTAIRGSVHKAFEQGSFAVSADTYWPQAAVNPQGAELVVESDARNVGEILVNGSTQFVTDISGRISVKGHYRQITTDEGEYLGNRPYQPGNEFGDILDQVTRVGQLSLDQGYYGIQGADWFLIRKPDGSEEVFVCERNCRPTANTPPVIIAEKLGAPEWINTNVYTDRQIETIDDYIDVVGGDVALGTLESGLVVPQAFRTMVTRRGTKPSPNFKVLILGKTADQCDDVMRTMEERGLRFRP